MQIQIVLQFIAFIIFILSSVGICFILYKKVPILVRLPQNGSTGIKKAKVIEKIETKVKENYFHFFEKQMLLHKALSKFRILTIRVERVVDQILSNIRKRAQEIDKDTKTKRK